MCLHTVVHMGEMVAVVGQYRNADTLLCTPVRLFFFFFFFFLNPYYSGSG